LTRKVDWMELRDVRGVRGFARRLFDGLKGYFVVVFYLCVGRSRGRQEGNSPQADSRLTKALRAAPSFFEMT
jgi:hypothetical protein